MMPFNSTLKHSTLEHGSSLVQSLILPVLCEQYADYKVEGA